MTSFYTWKNYRCAYRYYPRDRLSLNISDNPALLLIHPIGVGLSSWFWQRFIDLWQQQKQPYSIYNPDLLGCGNSEMPHIAYYPEDWAAQLKYFIETEIKQPTVLVVQGALLPVALCLLKDPPEPNYIKGIILSGPPAWNLMTTPSSQIQQKLLWNLLFDSPVGLGNLFYRYARRRQFLQSFSTRQLFAREEDVDSFWLDSLQKGAENVDSRYAVFSFLAGFWRRNYQQNLESIEQPTLVIVGDKATSISKEGFAETPETRLKYYLQYLQKGSGKIIAGRNIPPYESTIEFTKNVADFLGTISIFYS